ncbi:MAG: hypothetical protein ABSB97_03220 [Thermoplasmata archaeon]
MRRLTAVTSVAMALFMVFVLSSTALIAASPVPSSGAAQTVWRYGTVKTVSVGPLKTGDGWTYEGNATVGYSVVLNETNTSSTTFELSVQRTMGVLFSVEFCLPSCSSPKSFASLSYHAWEITNSIANFTTQGTVNESGQTVPALALLNTTSTLHANVTEQGRSALPPVGQAGTGTLVDRSKYLSAAVSSVSNVTFATPLGLIPLTLAGAQSWTSTSAFNATGSAEYSYFYQAIGPLGTRTVGPNSGSFTVSPSGSVTVQGSYSPRNTVTFGGITYPELQITIVGPFSVREGFILIPSSVDLFGGSSGPWASEQNGTSAVSMAFLDAKASVGGHVGIAASSWLYTSAAANPGEAVLSPDGGMNPAAGAESSPIAATTIQGAPQSADQAHSSQQCLTTGTGCPAAAVSPNVRGILAEAAIVGVVVVVVAVVVIALVAERRRVPPPVYPNANLYPPGTPAVRPLAPPARAPSPPPEASAEDDPLDHLW